MRLRTSVHTRRLYCTVSVTIVCYSIKLTQIDTELILVSMVLYTKEKNALKIRYHTALTGFTRQFIVGSGLVHQWFHRMAKETVLEFLNKTMGARNRVRVVVSYRLDSWAP